jgi:predicted amidohydrolase YtcJ
MSRSHYIRTIVGSLVCVALAGCGKSDMPSGSWSPYADVIFTGGEVVTVNKDFAVAQGLAIKDGKIIVIGSDKDVQAYRGPDTKVVDITGKTIIPGMQDSHMHFATLGYDLTHNADLTFAKNADDIVRAVAEIKAKLKPAKGEWIGGARWDQYKYPEMVTRWQLDAVTPDNPVRLRRVYRGTMVNTAAFRLMGIEDDKPSTWPSWWLKDPADFTSEDKILRAKRTITVNGATREVEVPTGVFLGVKSSELVTVDVPAIPFEENVASIKAGGDKLLSLGVTAIVDPASRMGYNMKIYQEAYNRGLLPLRIAAVYEGVFFREPPEQIAAHLDGIKVNRLGDRFLKWQGMKYYADGGAGSRSSWVSEPFENWEEKEGKPYFGLPVMEDTAVREKQFRVALERGWDLNTHNTGDRSMRQTVDLYKKLMDEIRVKKPDADLRWSIIHAYMPIEPKTMVAPDMGKYKIIASPNPVFIWQLGNSFAENLGPERVTRAQPFRSYLKHGVIMAAGSDYAVAHYDPWLGLYAMLTRKEQSTGAVLGADETVGIADALRAFTINGAYLTYDDKIRGSLEVGKLADLVVLNIPSIKDLEKNPDLALSMKDRILLTLVEGKTAFRRANFAY